MEVPKWYVQLCRACLIWVLLKEGLIKESTFKALLALTKPLAAPAELRTSLRARPQAGRSLLFQTAACYFQGVCCSERFMIMSFMKKGIRDIYGYVIHEGKD